MEFLKTLGITIIIYGMLALFMYGILLASGSGWEVVFGKALSATVVFVGLFLAVYFGRN